MAKTFPEAMRAANALKVDWSIPEDNKIGTIDLLSEAEKLLKIKVKAPLLIMKEMLMAFENNEKLQSIYTTSFDAHGPLEPYNSVVGKFGDTWHVFLVPKQIVLLVLY